MATILYGNDMDHYGKKRITGVFLGKIVNKLMVVTQVLHSILRLMVATKVKLSAAS